MNLILRIEETREEDRPHVGGKFFALFRMATLGLRVPKAVCITTGAYDRYLSATGLAERILLELNRKSFAEMRWEEIWDASLRIRNMFLTTPMPPPLLAALQEGIEQDFHGCSTVVRSSAPGEDSAGASFAGIHESYVNIEGTRNILDHVQKVWASLWSDAALLYRQELGLNVETSKMAVVVQQIVTGDRSGVVFTMSPTQGSQAVIESVYGLNQGLVDGTVEPDRWVLSRASQGVIHHTAPRREKHMVPSSGGVHLEPLPAAKADRPPLGPEEVARVFAMAMKAEAFFGAPQDVEWTFDRDTLYVLQSRPITTVRAPESKDDRPWYLTLRRSFENLKQLRSKIEGELIPGMVEEAADLGKHDLGALTDPFLAREIARRREIQDHWVNVYWRDFIPFAHGARLFGQVYNDTVRPSDPYEFMDLLGDTGMVSVARNRSLEEMAAMVREDPELAEALGEKRLPHVDTKFARKLEAFMERFHDLACGKAQCFQGADGILPLVLEMASRPPAQKKVKPENAVALAEAFLNRFQGEERDRAEELLNLARTSYRLRDDDNIYLGKIEGRLIEAVEEGRRRLSERGMKGVERLDAETIVPVLEHGAPVQGPPSGSEKEETEFVVKPRQLIGQPAGPGLAKGRARVIHGHSDLLRFKAGEVLVCDALDPAMTFVVPLCAAIVERRGGMLIHGAIIAREYGLACVTGVPQATTMIETGDALTVDGYLGIVVIEQRRNDGRLE